MDNSILDTVYKSAMDLHEVGLIKPQTMREFDAMCLPDVQCFSAEQIKQLRLRNEVSQGVFAAFLNTSTSTVQQWEQGAKKPNGPSLKLLNLVAQKGLQVLA